jgi:glucokinase
VLSGDELVSLQDGRADPTGAVAIIAAGTGLGEAMLHRVAERFVAKASEGGRADFAARTERDITVLRALTRECGRAAVEHVVSGPGLVHIHKALHPEGCTARIDMTAADAPSAITESAAARSCVACVDAMDLFVDAYGAEAGNLALRAVATGGLYIGGGIAPKILTWLQTGSFLTAFRSKTPFGPLLEAMPVKVILNMNAGLLGAAHYCSEA